MEGNRHSAARPVRQVFQPDRLSEKRLQSAYEQVAPFLLPSLRRVSRRSGPSDQQQLEALEFSRRA